MGGSECECMRGRDVIGRRRVSDSVCGCERDRINKL